MSVDALVGIDVGGTKTQVLIETISGEVLSDHVFATPAWRGASDDDKAHLVEATITNLLPHSRVAAVALGAHGCDSDEESESLRRRLSPLFAVPVLVVNDAQLLGAAAGMQQSIELIAGTGSIAVGRTAEGRSVYAGGWGWLLSDDGGAAGLVRDAVRLLVRARDERMPPDLLERRLLEASGVEDLRGLSMHMMEVSRADFTAWAPHLFDAAEEGSVVAARVIQTGAKELARLVDVVLDGGVQAHAVVAAGSVIVRQPRLAEGLRAALAGGSGLDLIILDVPPVRGAIVLARHLYSFSGPTPCIA